MREEKLKMVLPGGCSQCSRCVLYHYFKFRKIVNRTAGTVKVAEMRACRASGKEFGPEYALDEKGFPIIADCTVWQPPRSL